MTIKEIKKMSWNGKNELIKISDNLYISVKKTKKVYVAIFKINQKQIKATIDNIDQITLTKSKTIINKIKNKIKDKNFEESKILIREILKKNETLFDKEIKKKQKQEEDKYLLKNLVEEFLENKNRQTKNRFNNYIIPYFGNFDVRKISQQDIIQFFKKVRKTNVNPKKTTNINNKMATIKRLKSDINTFYTYLYFTHNITNNPIQFLTLKNIEKVLGIKYNVTHFKATTNLQEVQNLYQKILNLKTNLDVKINKHKAINYNVKYALLFLMLTALRSGTIRQLKWEMVDFDNNVINIPASITKTKIEFRQPLTNTLKELLLNLQQINKRKRRGLIFSVDGKKILSENTLNKQIKNLSSGTSTAHGIRTSFSTILKEQGQNFLYVETQLMHVVENKVAQAYTRTDYFQQRFELLRFWEKLLTIDKTLI